MTLAQAIALIDSILAASAASPTALSVSAALPPTLVLEKVYELSCLARIMTLFPPGTSFAFRGGRTIPFRRSHGPIDPSRFARIDVAGSRLGSLWTDIEFATAGSCGKVCATGTKPDSGQRHELDTLLVDVDITGYPCHKSIQFGSESKSGVFDKRLLKQILGVRLELAEPWGSKPRMLVWCNNTTIKPYRSAFDPWDIRGIVY
jgi:hypothetical protein